mmetsp:Transcript_17834/g.49879  ORF Transcript_17834/g.49879 Transcript_17834/m.49879 type:complete len:99 (+) Transcript_17834:14-310(+)
MLRRRPATAAPLTVVAKTTQNPTDKNSLAIYTRRDLERQCFVPETGRPPPRLRRWHRPQDLKPGGGAVGGGKVLVLAAGRSACSMDTETNSFNPKTCR